jgi:hypothetical protein
MKGIQTGFRLDEDVKAMLVEMSETIPSTKSISQNRLVNLAIRAYYEHIKGKK